MARIAKKVKASDCVDIATLQPDEINALKAVVIEFFNRRENIENEIACLKEDLVTLKEEFEDRLDIKILNQVVQVLKIESKVLYKDTYDLYATALKDPALG